MSDIAIFSHSFADILFKEGILLGQLRCNACENFTRMTLMLLTPGKEEARAETVLFMESTSHCVSKIINGGTAKRQPVPGKGKRRASRV